MEPYEGEPPDVAVGELRVARGFRLRGALDLMSTAWSYTWTPGDQTAVCQRPTFEQSRASGRCPCGCGMSIGFAGTAMQAPDHGTVPDPKCECGFYGAYSFNTSPIITCEVVGVAEVWGRIRMGTRGVRAEHARLIAIAPGIRGDWWVSGVMLDQVAEKYHIPHFPDVDAMTTEFALVDPTEYGIEPDLAGDAFTFTYSFTTIIQAFQASMAKLNAALTEGSASFKGVLASIEDVPPAQPDRPVPKPRVDPKFTTFIGPGRRGPKKIGGV